VTEVVATPPVWDDDQWDPMPALGNDLITGTCVIGLGGSGLTAIGELLARGESVVGIDAADVGAGAAGRNGGFLLAGMYDFYHDAVRLHGRERALWVYRATMREIGRIAEDAPGTVRLTGSRRIAASAAEVGDCREQLRAMHADGLACDWYDGADGVGLVFPGDASFNPLARCRVLARAVQRAGAVLFARTPVVHLEGTTVITPHGRITARRVIVAVDGRLERILPELSPRARTARLQMLATAPTQEATIPCPMYYREGYEYWQQTADGRITIGGFRDVAGESEWTHNAEPTEPVQRLLEAFLRERLAIQAPVTHRWAASAAFSHNGLPIVEQVRDGVFALGAYSGTGNVIGALCGRAIVALAIDGDDTSVRALGGH
jgi:gamma-glutamylputrescine oxidase